MKELVAGNLTRYRKGLKLSQEALAELVGVTRQSINIVISNKNEPLDIALTPVPSPR
ncbi:MAG TPA: helix-turn-helix domain-containing protein [Oscillatoriaceae cyanobacterium M33_DOE_052]|uniref:Helix-turn-helix domain-containing protein n=1 Tax=Planktothricoides sp. SpSt-374 TaxID=2282167 RepID=A0A7C3ZM05_9CYAN|nr:helix-turn-helix domain-containing protein [Oscillatoriaceae cyanobacterium M33_DOE_052]